MSHQWTYRKWGWMGSSRDVPIPMTANALLVPFQGQELPQTAEGLIEYADQSYISCRFLMIASEAAHPGGLYLAGQVVEKYMKAILLARGKTVDEVRKLARPGGHNIEALAQEIGDEFADGEFLDWCRRLMSFETAGRYPDHDLFGWQYSKELLTFLDGFVVHSREVAGIHAHHNYIREVLEQDTESDPVMAAAVAALTDNNRHIEALAAWPTGSRPQYASPKAPGL